MHDHIIYRCVVGSRAYGLEHEDSDTDRRGAYLPPADLFWSLDGVPEQLESKSPDECYWELGKFIRLALYANPNILEVLYSPIVEHVADIFQPMLDMRTDFLTKSVYKTFNGYADQQFKKFNNGGKAKPTHMVHLLRLLIAGIIILEEGVFHVRVADEHRQRLLDVKYGVMSVDEMNAWKNKLQSAFEDAYSRTKLPDQPDRKMANDYLIEARRFSLHTR